MFIERVETRGLAHYSYLVGDQNEAVVIDPRRDVDVYLKLAEQAGANIIAVLETHRNEDFLIGSPELKTRTGADIWHADAQHDYKYGTPIQEGQKFELGNLELKAMHTPGHTPGSFSYVLFTKEGSPWMVFSGDTLFAGDVGRVDFLGEEKLSETASQLYDSIFEKILPLGEEVILCPAHGSGSVCGSEIADRKWTTLGLEKKLNPKLQYESKAEFIEAVGKMLDYPPYFYKMETENLIGAPNLYQLEKPASLKVEAFSAEKEKKNTLVVDIRDEISYGSAHIPGSISLWEGGLASFAGWFLPLDSRILLVNDGNYPQEAIKDLYRLGFDKIVGYLDGGLLSWHSAGKESASISTVTVDELCTIMDNSEDYWLLDIRDEEEIKNQGRITGAVNIHLPQLLDQLNELPQDKEIFIFCGTGLRSMTAASLLKLKGKENITVVLGGLKGWSSTTCPIK